MSELKPCPFCGGEAEEKEHRNCWEHYFYVKCKNCCVMTPFKFGEEKAIEAWNRRVEN